MSETSDHRHNCACSDHVRAPPSSPPGLLRSRAFMGRATAGGVPRCWSGDGGASWRNGVPTGVLKPVVALDMMWNMSFVIVSIVMLICTARERPNTIRLWICGYALQCRVHVVLVWLEYRRRNRRRVRDEEQNSSRSTQIPMPMIARTRMVIQRFGGFNQSRLAVVFLAFDVFFAIFCVVLACLIGIAFAVLPCIIAILYAVAGQEGASEADLSMLPRYSRHNDSHRTSSGYLANERFFYLRMRSYEDGAELHALPCNHHFHSTCIAKWLKMNATCPLCKYNILKGSEQI
ncbi:hypothetical protein AAG906_031572 [Vitis piasezkii]